MGHRLRPCPPPHCLPVPTALSPSLDGRSTRSSPPPPPQTEDLLARSVANKAVNDAKRLATSGSNFARSRTVSAGTCALPNNFFGCDIGAVAGDVAFIKDDIKLECEVRACVLGDGGGWEQC